MEMKPITRKDLLAFKYCKIVEGGKGLEFKRPTFSEAENMSRRELCICIGLFGLRLRPIEGSLGNANYWLKNNTKEDILEKFRHEFREKDR